MCPQAKPTLECRPGAIRDVLMSATASSNAPALRYPPAQVYRAPIRAAVPEHCFRRASKRSRLASEDSDWRALGLGTGLATHAGGIERRGCNWVGVTPQTSPWFACL